MTKLTSLLIALVVSLLLGQGAHAAWDPAWTKRAKVTLNTSADGVPLAVPVTGGVVPLRLHTGNFGFLDAKPDGSDLRVIAADDKTPLKFHIEKFDAINELAIVWVQLPRLAPGSKTEFVWIYFGNAGAVAASDPKGSYDAQQALVWHFNESEGLPLDATANANAATTSNAKPSTAGLLGGGAAFDGASEISLPVSASLRGGAEGFTVSMWVKPNEAGDATLWAQGEGTQALMLQMVGGRLAATVGGVGSSAPAGNLAPGAWSHVAMVAGAGGLALYVNGQEVSRSGAAVSVPGGTARLGRGLKGEVDEVQVSGVPRPAEWIQLAALSQGPEAKLAVVTADATEQAQGASYMKILLSAVTIDGWVVIAILAVLFVYAVWVVWSKLQYVNRASRDNEQFMAQFQRLMDGITPYGPVPAAAAAAAGPVRSTIPGGLYEPEIVDAQVVRGPSSASGADATAGKPGKGGKKAARSRFPHSPLYRLFQAGVDELQTRFDAYRAKGLEPTLTPQSLGAIRATTDARLVREIQRLNNQMVVLTISIAGGPFLGLLGTVVGVMITFAAIAAAGDVNVNAIAPGIAAALVATVAGLAVAIPALFAYNYLTGRIQDHISDMQVFVDELSARFAEKFSA